MLVKRFYRELIGIITIGFIGMSMAFAAGTITGVVTDKDGSPLAFANVVITHKIVNGEELAMRTQLGTVTDLEGAYALTGIAEGTYRLEVIYLGYTSQSSLITISENETVNHNAVLENKTLDLEEVVVTQQAKGQMAAINQQLAALSIKNVVAADRIMRNPDANAAEAIGRLPGVSITRNGGEASDVVIRGMPSQYNTVLLNGIEIPSNKGESRNASLGGVSQFSLQGIEVFKAITPDMDANTVSGAVNMQMRTAPEGFHGNIMAQGGYNDQNSDFGNQKYNVNLSNRWFDNKLGVDFNASYERTNRSTQSMGATYAVETAYDTLDLQPMFLNTVALQNVERINVRTSGSLVIDYRFSPRSKIEFSNFFSSSPTDNLVISKSHNLAKVAYDIRQNRGGHSRLYSGALRGEHVLGIFHIDYSLAYSQSDKTEETKLIQINNPVAYEEGSATRSNRSLPLGEVIDMANDEATQENLPNFGIWAPGRATTDDLLEQQYDARLNVKLPFTAGDWLSGNVKFGGMYRNKNRTRDFNEFWHGGGPAFRNVSTGVQTTPDGISWRIPWAVLNYRNEISMENMVGGTMDNFLDGRYNFGWIPDIDKTYTIYDWWQNITQYYRAQGQEYVSDQQPGWALIFGQDRMMGSMEPRPSVKNDNSLRENYYAGYLMGELKLGKMVTLIPGARYEKVNYDMYAWWIERRINEGLEIPGHDTTATRQNDMILPMVHLKVKPLDWLQIQASYTQTIFRPNYNWIVPFEYVDDALKPFEYEAGVPNINVERWENYDLQVAFHSNKLGLLSLNGFYKTVTDKIWRRTWTRLPVDEPVPYFPADEEVNVTSWYNHEYETYVRGFEIEWQTNFWYLPRPFNYFTLTANYSYMNNQAVYPDSRVSVIQTGVSDRGRPIFEKIRNDSTFTGPMTDQPTHLANVSLGFSYKSFDIWLSYQYIGETLISKAVQFEHDRYKTAFSRLGLQAKYELPLKKLAGLEILFNVANLNNVVEAEYLRGETRPASLQAYGWTADFGVRYMF